MRNPLLLHQIVKSFVVNSAQSRLEEVFLVLLKSERRTAMVIKGEFIKQIVNAFLVRIREVIFVFIKKIANVPLVSPRGVKPKVKIVLITAITTHQIPFFILVPQLLIDLEKVLGM